MFLANEQGVTERYFFFSQGSNSVGHISQTYFNIHIYSLNSLSDIEDENKINNK